MGTRLGQASLEGLVRYLDSISGGIHGFSTGVEGGVEYSVLPTPTLGSELKFNSGLGFFQCRFKVDIVGSVISSSSPSKPGNHGFLVCHLGPPAGKAASGPKGKPL